MRAVLSGSAAISPGKARVSRSASLVAGAVLILASVSTLGGKRTVVDIAG
jgi:hypothetical protein